MIGLLLPSVVHLLALLAILTVWAFRSPRGPLHRWRHWLMAAVAWTWLASTPVLAHALAFALESRYPSPAPSGSPDVVLVLASGDAWDPDSHGRAQLDLASYRRTLAGVRVQQRSGGRLLFAGRMRQETRPVAARMAELAVLAGANAELVATETESLNTYQNLRNSQRLIDPGETVYLVTSALHMRRAVAVAERLGMNVIPVPCDYRAKRALGLRAWLPDGATPRLLAWVVHEWVGLLYYRLRGWA